MATDSQELLLLLGRVDANVTSLLTRATDHETRISSLEGGRTKLMGGMAVIAVMIQWVGGKLVTAAFQGTALGASLGIH